MKTKINKISLGLCFMWIAFIVSCSKTQDISSCNPNNNETNARHGINPMLPLGDFHNEALDLLTLDPKFPNIDDDTRYNIVSPHFTDKINDFGIPFTMPTLDFLQSSEIIALSYISSSVDAIPNFINDNQNSFTDKQRLLLIKLNDDLISTVGDFSAFVNKLDNFDNNVLNRNDISEADKQIIFSASAIARKSGEYWNAVFSDPSHPYFSILNNVTPLPPFDKPSWPILIDIVGFIIVGGITGNYGFGLVFGFWASAQAA